MRNRQQVQGKQCWKSSTDFQASEWIENEMVGCEFEDVRHGKRLRQLLEQLSGRVGATTPWACQDWANTKAAYRFFGNDRISEANILAGHFASTLERFITACGDAAHSIAKLNKRIRALLCGTRASFTAFPRAARRVQEISLSM